MIVPITHDRWMSTRKVLDETGDRFTALLGGAVRAPVNATRDWSVTKTVAHVATLARVYTSIVDGKEHPYPFPGAESLVNETIVDTVDRFNEVLLSELPERDPEKLRRMLRSDLDTILRITDGADPTAAIPWLGGSKVPLAGVLAHLANELQIHGRDIAQAAGSPWLVSPEEASLFFELFLLGVTHYGYGRLLDGHGPAPKGRIAVEFSSKFTTTRVMAMHDGFVTVEKPGEGPVDVKLSFDPVFLNLMLFGRISKARAALTGKVVIRGGRRPWTLPTFLRIVSLPS